MAATIARDVYDWAAGNDSATVRTYGLRVGNGAGGTMRVTTEKGTVIQFQNVQDNEKFPLAVQRVWATGTTVSNVTGYLVD